MMNKKICVVGAGYWGKNHIKTFYDLGVLGGVVDVNTKFLDEILNKYKDVSVYKSIDDALSDDIFDGFTVATPAETHFSISKKIISYKKHILVEKPITLKFEEAQQLVSSAKANSINIMVGHLLLFHPAIKKIKQCIEKGAIGDIKYIYSNRLNFGQVRSRENVFWSLAPHDISIFQYLIDSSPKSIDSSGTSILQDKISDSNIVYLSYNSGIRGHIFSSWLHPFKEHRLVIIGSNGMISYEDSSDKKIKLYDKNFSVINGQIKKTDNSFKIIDYKESMPLMNQMKYFVDHLNGDKIAISNGEHALSVLKILIDGSSKSVG